VGLSGTVENMEVFVGASRDGLAAFPERPTDHVFSDAEKL
jgi:hypothetical protein